jgi:hypothetical protein
MNNPKSLKIEEIELLRWYRVEEYCPPVDTLVFTYNKEGKIKFSNYCKVLAWSGYKNKYVNMLSDGGFWDDSVLYWTWHFQILGV